MKRENPQKYRLWRLTQMIELRILTPHQFQVVDAVQQCEDIIRWYTCTGGTAMYYLGEARRIGNRLFK